MLCAFFAYVLFFFFYFFKLILETEAGGERETLIWWRTPASMGCSLYALWPAMGPATSEHLHDALTNRATCPGYSLVFKKCFKKFNFGKDRGEVWSFQRRQTGVLMVASVLQQQFEPQACVQCAWWERSCRQFGYSSWHIGSKTVLLAPLILWATKYPFINTLPTLTS